MTVSTPTQPILSTTAVMSGRQHPMVPCSIHSVFFPHSSRLSPFQVCAQTTHSHWYLRPRHQVQRWDHDGCRQPRFVSSLLCYALYIENLSDLSVLWLSCTIQRRAASTFCGRLYSRGCEWRYVRFSIPSAYPRQSCYLRGSQFTRWAYTWPR